MMFRILQIKKQSNHNFPKLTSIPPAPKTSTSWNMVTSNLVLDLTGLFS